MNFRITNKAALASIVIWPILFSCDSTKDVSLSLGQLTAAQRITNATEGHVALLGTGFDSLANNFTENRCVRFDDSTNMSVPPPALSHGNLSVGANLSTEEIKNHLYGSLNGSFPVFPGLNLGAKIELERDFAQSDFAQTISIIYSGRGASVVGDSHGIILGDGPNRILQNNQLSPDERMQALGRMCGDRFVKGIESGIVFIAALKMQFGSEYDKRLIAGTLTLELLKMSGALAKLAKSLAELEFKISGAMEQSRFEVSIGLTVYQHGGYPERLLGTLPDPHLPHNIQPGRAINCNYNNREMCYRSFLDLLEYASTSLPEQLEEARGDKLAPLSYLLEEYEHPNLEELRLGAQELATRDDDADEFASIRSSLLRQLETTSTDMALALRLQHAYGNEVPSREVLYDVVSEIEPDLPPEEYKNELQHRMTFHSQLKLNHLIRNVRRLKDKIVRKNNLLKEALDFCFDTTDIERCRSAAHEMEEATGSGDLDYDDTILRVIPTQFDKWCLMTAYRGLLADDDRRSALALMERIDFERFVNQCKQEVQESDGGSDDEDYRYYAEYGCACKRLVENLNNLGEYELSGMQLSSMLPFLSLPYVRKLDLSGNNITTASLRPLVWLGSLESLNLSDNLIDDLSIFTSEILPSTSFDLKKLICETEQDAMGDEKPVLEIDVYNRLMRYLGENYCQFDSNENNDSDNEIGEGTINTVLNLADNRVSSVAPLADVDWSWRAVDLSNNRIQSVTDFVLKPGLAVLDLSYNRLSEITGLSEVLGEDDFSLHLLGTGIEECPFIETEEQRCVFE